MDIAQQRLHSQHLASPRFTTPSGIVGWLGAVQAQDYYGAKWGLGLRLRRAHDHDVERAVTSGAILRTHVMRPTWHFVLPEDIRWMLALTAPRVKAATASSCRRLALDETVFARSSRALARALEGGRHLTRGVLREAVQRAGIAIDNLGFAFILMRAELDGLICSGARAGKQFTYALLEERVPRAARLSRDDALAELTRRYFTSRGPATPGDFAWWSGLTMRDAKAGVEMVHDRLASDTFGGSKYWFGPHGRGFAMAVDTAYLLPTFDEYLIAYRDRSASLGPELRARGRAASMAMSAPIVVGGQVIGWWTRTVGAGRTTIEARPFGTISGATRRAIESAADRYGAFHGTEVRLSMPETGRR